MFERTRALVRQTYRAYKSAELGRLLSSTGFEPSGFFRLRAGSTVEDGESSKYTSTPVDAKEIQPPNGD